MIECFNNNALSDAIIIAIIPTIISFFLGRYTNKLDNYREGMHRMNNEFYGPFLETFNNAHHAKAIYFSDMEPVVQERIMALLISNMNRVSPRIKQRILKLDQWYSDREEYYDELCEEDKIYVEKTISNIYEYVQKQYVKNERRLYCTKFERFGYFVLELWMKWQ